MEFALNPASEKASFVSLLVWLPLSTIIAFLLFLIISGKAKKHNTPAQSIWWLKIFIVLNVFMHIVNIVAILIMPGPLDWTSDATYPKTGAGDTYRTIIGFTWVAIFIFFFPMQFYRILRYTSLKKLVQKR